MKVAETLMYAASNQNAPLLAVVLGSTYTTAICEPRVQPASIIQVKPFDFNKELTLTSVQDVYQACATIRHATKAMMKFRTALCVVCRSSLHDLNDETRSNHWHAREQCEIRALLVTSSIPTTARFHGGGCPGSVP